MWIRFVKKKRDLPKLVGLTKSSICSKKGNWESRTSGWTGTPVVSELIAEERWTGWGMTARGWGWGTTTFRGHRLSYNSRNFFLTGLFPSLFNIWRARPISSCFLPDFDRPAKPSNDWSSETRKLNNMCCIERNRFHTQNVHYHSMNTRQRSKFRRLFLTRRSANSSMLLFAEIYSAARPSSSSCPR